VPLIQPAEGPTVKLDFGSQPGPRRAGYLAAGERQRPGDGMPNPRVHRTNARPHPGPLPQERERLRAVAGRVDRVVSIRRAVGLRLASRANTHGRRFSAAPRVLPPLLGERAGVRASPRAVVELWIALFGLVALLPLGSATSPTPGGVLFRKRREYFPLSWERGPGLRRAEAASSAQAG
jgi:hypothetical protein